MGGGVLDARQCAVDSKRLCEDLGTLNSEAVLTEAAGEGGTKVSAAADTFQIGKVGWAAHLSSKSVLFTLSASAMGLTPSGRILLPPMLRTRAREKSVSGC